MNYTYSNLPSGEAMASEWDLLQLPSNAGGCTPSTSDYGCAGAGPDFNNFTYITLFTANSKPGFGLPAISLGPDLSTVVLGPGTYVFNDNYKFSTSLAAQTGVLNYSIDVQQTAVPLPSAIMFFGSGVLGLISATRRRR